MVIGRLLLIALAAATPLMAASADSAVDQRRPGPPVAPSGLMPRAAGVSLAQVSQAPQGPVITIGRDQDIVGVMVSVAALQRSQNNGAKASGARLLPGDIPRGFPLRAGVLTSSFGMRAHPILGTMRGHRGVDLAAPTGSPVFATGPGMVVTAGWNGGYGLLVTIDHGGGKQSRYGHLSGAAVAPGQMVPAGAVIGYVGATGQATGPHLHYEIRIGGAAVDPARVAR